MAASRKLVDLDPLAEHLEEVRKVVRDVAYEMGSTTQVTIQNNDDSFRKMIVHSGSEFFWVATRTGKRGDLIFVFTPVDAQPYRSMELSGKEIGKGYMPAFSEMLKTNLGGITLASAMQHPGKFKFMVDENGTPIMTAAPETPPVDYSKQDEWGMF